MRRIIVTGGAGFIGSALIRELLDYGAEVWAVVRPGFSAKMDGSRLRGLDVHIAECDLGKIHKLPQMIRERNFDVWYQLAWDGLFGDALLDCHRQIANIEYLVSAVETAAEMGCRKFIGAGSISQYETAVRPASGQNGDKHRVYKIAKTACQYMGESAAGELGMTFLWPVITNIYGPGENSPRLINTLIRNLQAGKHQALSRGNQIYDFIYITDAAKAFRLLGESGVADREYIIAQGLAQPLKVFLKTVRDIVRPEAELGFGEMEFNGISLPEQCYDISSLKEDTGFKPDVSFEQGIRLTSDWIRDHGQEQQKNEAVL